MDINGLVYRHNKYVWLSFLHLSLNNRICNFRLQKYSYVVSVSILENKIQTLSHWGRDKINTIQQTTFSNAFPWMKMY